MPLASQDAAEAEQHALAASMGDADALAHLYVTFAPIMRTRVRMWTRNDDDLADEVAAAGWEKVARNIRSYESGRGRFEHWLHRIMQNEYRAYNRGRGRSREELTGDLLAFDGLVTDAADTEMDRKLLAAELAAEVNCLPAGQRKCVMLRFFMHYSIEETAAAMGKEPNAVKQLQHRALRALGRRFGDRLDGYRMVTTDDEGRVPRRTVPAGRMTATGTLAGGNV